MTIEKDRWHSLNCSKCVCVVELEERVKDIEYLLSALFTATDEHYTKIENRLIIEKENERRRQDNT